MDTKLSYNFLKPHLLNLRIAGCFYIDRKSPKLYKFLHLCFICVTFACMNIYIIQQAVKVYKVRNNMDEVTGTMFLFLTHTDSVYKQVVMLVRANDVQELLDIMKGPLFNQGEVDHQKYLTRIARHGKFFLRTNNYTALCTCFLWVLYPLILHIRGKHADFAIWLPYDMNVNYKFYLTASYVWVVTSWFAFVNTSIDVMVAFLWGQCKAQLSILRKCWLSWGTELATHGAETTANCANGTVSEYNSVCELRLSPGRKLGVLCIDLVGVVALLPYNIHTRTYKTFWFYWNDLVHLVQSTKKESLATNEDFADVLSRRFEKIVKHHIQILYFNKRVQDIFGSAVAYQFLISGWIICTSVYKMVDADPTTVEFWSMVLYICCILMEVFIYCFYGNELTHESLKLTESAYAMQWLGSPIKHQRHLFLFTERIKKPIQPLAGVIIPLSNTTFISILKSSYSFYALLRNTDKNS